VEVGAPPRDQLLQDGIDVRHRVKSQISNPKFQHPEPPGVPATVTRTTLVVLQPYSWDRVISFGIWVFGFGSFSPAGLPPSGRSVRRVRSHGAGIRCFP